MNRRKAPLLGAVALLALAAVLWFWLESPGLPTAPGTPSGAAASSPAATARARAGTPPPALAAPDDADEAPAPAGDLTGYLRTRYGPRVHDPHTQMRMLEKLMRLFQKLNPTGWEADVLAALRQAFPELYDELALRLRQRVEYEKWMREHHEELGGKSEPERRAAVRQERERLFGKPVAERIWASELRNVAVGDALQAIDALPQASVGERMAQYKQSLEKVYGERAEAYTRAHQQELMDRFLDLGSVQKDLEGMTPEQRAASLRSIRQDMGLSEEALGRWKELDAQRDARWELGAQYMLERQALAQHASGAELEAQLSALRSRYFPDEAETLAEEEASGFFRFSAPRQWGRD